MHEINTVFGIRVTEIFSSKKMLDTGLKVMKGDFGKIALPIIIERHSLY